MSGTEVFVFFASMLFFLGVLIIVMLWVFKAYFKDRYRIKVCVDHGLRLRCAGADIVNIVEKDNEEYLVLKTRLFPHEVVVPKNSYRITRSRWLGDYMTFLVDPSGIPLAWSKDPVEVKIKPKDFWMMKKYNLAAQTLGYIRWLPLIKLFLIVLVIIVLLFVILLGYMASQIHPTVIVKIPNATHLANTTTHTIPPPPP